MEIYLLNRATIDMYIVIFLSAALVITAILISHKRSNKPK